MAKKAFIIILAILIVTFGFAYTIKYMKPAIGQVKDLNQFPLQHAGWAGRVDIIEQGTLDMLSPDHFYNATYVNRDGNRVQLFFDYFAQGGASSGGVHSPRNCLPGSGWAILGVEPRQIRINGRVIDGSRFHLRLGEKKQVMDFWYVTRRGETANDYKFKLYTMISSLTLQPTDVGFIRFVAFDTPASLAALDQFEKSFVPVIYNFLPFH